MDRFALFRLPLVALSEVMKMFQLFDIVNLLMCSKKTQRWLKQFPIIREFFRFKVEFTENVTFYIKSLRRKEWMRLHITSLKPEMIHSVRIGDSDIQMCQEAINDSFWNIYYDDIRDMNFYFEDKIEGLKTVTEYFSSFFQQYIDHITLSSQLNPEAPKIIMEWILQRQNHFDHLYMQCDFTSDKVAEYLFDKANRHGNNAVFDLKLTENFKTPFKFIGHSLKLCRCHWITFDNLLNINCFELTVEGSKFTNDEMNLFLKRWMTGNSQFKEISIEMEVIVLDELFSEIPVIQRTNDVERVFEGYQMKTRIVGGFDIKRDDGVTTATISHDGTGGNKTFSMFIWDNESD